MKTKQKKSSLKIFVPLGLVLIVALLVVPKLLGGGASAGVAPAGAVNNSANSATPTGQPSNAAGNAVDASATPTADSNPSPLSPDKEESAMSIPESNRNPFS